MLVVVLFTVAYASQKDRSSTKSIEELVIDLENDKNSMLATQTHEDYNTNSEFYDEQDNWSKTGESMNILYFGPSDSFMRMDVESILHILIHTKKYLIPISRVLLAWDMVTDGKTAAYLQGREYVAFGSLLNVVPEEDLYYVNFADPSVLNHFAKHKIYLQKRKYGILISAYRRVFGNRWYKNSTLINQLGYLFCAFPVTEFKKISPEVFKDISLDILGKLQKCSINQNEILYNLAIVPEAYGKPYQWTSQDLRKLSSLLTFVPDEEICSIRLEAMRGISYEVMKLIHQEKLPYFSKKQIMRMDDRTRRIFILRMQLKESFDIQDTLRRSASYYQPPFMVLLLTSSFIIHSLN